MIKFILLSFASSKYPIIILQFSNMDVSKLWSKVADLQNNLKEAQGRLASLEEVGEAGAGMVKVTINGAKVITQIHIDDEVYADKEFMLTLLIGATNQAIKKIETLSKSEMRKSTEGLLPDMPGLTNF